MVLVMTLFYFCVSREGGARAADPPLGAPSRPCTCAFPGHRMDGKPVLLLLLVLSL